MQNLRQSYFLQVILVTLFLILPPFWQDRARSHVEESKPQTILGIDQKLGQYVPLDLTFYDERGKPLILKELIHTPTILALVYLHCPNVCSLLLQNLAGVLNRLPAEPGKEYMALAVSFDDREKPDLALERKKVYLAMIEVPFPENAWRFLTGDQENIHKLADAVGFHFKRAGEDFEHPVALIILGSDGKVTRYMYGTDPLPFDLKLALVEASRGKIGPAISKIARFCFSYDPKGKKLVFNTLKVTGTVTLLFASSFAVFLLLKGRRRHAKEERQE